MADISKITLPSGTTYDIKDTTARDTFTTWRDGTRPVCTLSLEQDPSTSDIYYAANKSYDDLFPSGSPKNGYDYRYMDGTTEYIAIGNKAASGSYEVWLMTASYEYSYLYFIHLQSTTSSANLRGTPLGIAINDVDQTYNSSSTKAQSGVAVAQAIAEAAVGAASFQGIVNNNSTISNANYKKGMYWVVGTAGTYVGVACEKGDFVFATADKSGSYKTSDFSVVQANIDMSVFKALAYKDTASASYTPAGTVSQPTFTGTQGTVSVSGTLANSVTLSAGTSSGTGKADATPAGTVSQPTFSGTAATLSVAGTTAGSVSTTYNTTSSGANGNFTPAGSVSQPTFTGSVLTSSGTYTPAGSVSKPTITVTPQTDTVSRVTSVGTLPSCTLPTLSTSVENETLTLSWSAGSFSPGTTGAFTPVTVMTGATASSSTPSFTGTEATLSVSGTPEGTVSKPTFSGTKVYAHHTFTGTEITSTGSYTPAGTVSQPTFTGTAKYISASVGTATKTLTGNFTPAGTVSQPTFTGTAVTITVS